VPPSYRRLEQLPPGAPAGAAVYVQSPRTACLIGFQAHNVLASIWIGPASAPPNAPADAVVDLAIRYAGLVAHRIEAVAGR
ncbi:MAG: hypothetical protein ACRDJN_17725, partial [Chloroflexota bacterium]